MAHDANYRSEKGKMIVGLTTVIKRRKFDLDHLPRWEKDTLVRVSHPEKKVYKVTYLSGGEETEDYLSTSQMSVEEIRALLEFIKTAPEEIPKPKVSSKTKLSGMERLEEMYRPAQEVPITEAVRSTTQSAPEMKYRTVTVTKTFRVTHKETYRIKFTDKTLDEFKAMRNGDEEDRHVFTYLLRKQTERCDPVTTSESDPTGIEFDFEED